MQVTCSLGLTKRVSTFNWSCLVINPFESGMEC